MLEFLKLVGNKNPLSASFLFKKNSLILRYFITDNFALSVSGIYLSLSPFPLTMMLEKSSLNDDTFNSTNSETLIPVAYIISIIEINLKP